MRVTKKQIALITTIGAANDDGGFLDIDQILEKLSYVTTKQSLQFSLRALIKNGYVEKRGLETRRGQGRIVISLTKEGYRMMQTHAVSV